MLAIFRRRPLAEAVLRGFHCVIQLHIRVCVRLGNRQVCSVTDEIPVGHLGARTAPPAPAGACLFFRLRVELRVILPNIRRVTQNQLAVVKGQVLAVGILNRPARLVIYPREGKRAVALAVDAHFVRAVGNLHFLAALADLRLFLADNICVQQRVIITANVLLQRIPILLCAAVIYGCQSITLDKSTPSNARHTLWNGYFRQAVATCKSSLPNARHTFRNRHFRQATATLKSTSSNARHTLWNRHFRQTAAIRKSTNSKLRYRLPAQLGGNVHLTVRTQVTNKGCRVIRSLINHIAGQIAFV